MTNIIEKHIFLLDHEPKIFEFVMGIFKDSNFKVSCFSNPIECLERLRSKKCDLLITALKMPEKDGIELLREVQHQTPWIPILLITAYGDIPSAVKAMKAGAVDFIEKPLKKKDFAQKIKSILEKNVSLHSLLGKPLTPAEMKILQFVTDGKSNKEIALMLHRSIATIKVHRAHFMHKLGVNNVVGLIKRAAVMGLTDLREKTEQDKDNPDSENDQQVAP